MNLQVILSDLETISLGEMESAALMDRTDTKFLVAPSMVESIIHEIGADYQVLEVADHTCSLYETLYYDTKDFHFFRQHRRGKMNRLKVRHRHYVDSGTGFLELKLKTNKGRTKKSRTLCAETEWMDSAEMVEFIQQNDRTPEDLNEVLQCRFARTTLVHRNRSERLTLDFDLKFNGGNVEHAFNHVVIAELKQARINRRSPFYRAAKSRGIRPTSISKYCMGILLTQPELRSNNLKPKLSKLLKMEASHGVV